LQCPINKMQRLSLSAPVSVLGGYVASALRKAPRDASRVLSVGKGSSRSLQTTRPLFSTQMTVRDALNAAMVSLYHYARFQ
jgi:hypothetical protein